MQVNTPEKIEVKTEAAWLVLPRMLTAFSFLCVCFSRSPVPKDIGRVRAKLKI
jgi:hypothetical protein